MTCPGCQEENRKGGKFCWSCGTALVAPETEAQKIARLEQELADEKAKNAPAPAPGPDPAELPAPGPAPEPRPKRGRGAIARSLLGE